MDQKMNICVKVKDFEFMWIFFSFLALLHLISVVHFLVLDMLGKAVLAMQGSLKVLLCELLQKVVNHSVLSENIVSHNHQF